MAPTTLTDLPPELLDHITAYLPTAHSVANFSSADKKLHTFVEKDAWQTFARTRFPSLCPTHSPAQHKHVARTLTTLSKAWDRRAFVTRYIEPHGDIRAFPGDKRIERWKRPRGQTIGYTPQLDCFEEVESSWRDRKEVLAFSAGAEICVRQRKIGRGGESTGDGGVQDGAARVRWMTYRPLSAHEGRDDVTTLHLLRPQEGEDGSDGGVELVAGTANGDLQLLRPSSKGGEEVPKTYFTTQSMPVRSSSLWQEPWQPPLLAANMGDARVCLYPVDSNESKIAPSSQIDIRPPNSTNGQRRMYRAWSTNFLSSKHLAVGLGPSDEPVHVYPISESGIVKDGVRKYSLQNDFDKLDGEIMLEGVSKKSTSSVYPVVPLPPASTSAAGSADGQVFLTGAYDGIIRLHDLRSDREVEQAYVDPEDDSAIYSLLPRGQEKLVAGTSRHTLLKVFDMRLGAKAYSYLDAQSSSDSQRSLDSSNSRGTGDWNLFLKPSSGTYSGRGGGNNWARRSLESSVYSLTSPSPHSPYLYAGVENAVLELAFTSILDKHPDQTFFPMSTDEPTAKKWHPGNSFGGPPSSKRDTHQGLNAREILDVSMYEQGSNMKLLKQRSLWETLWMAQGNEQHGKMKMKADADFELVGLDERWKVGGA